MVRWDQAQNPLEVQKRGHGMASTGESSRRHKLPDHAGESPWRSIETAINYFFLAAAVGPMSSFLTPGLGMARPGQSSRLRMLHICTTEPALHTTRSADA